MGIFKGGKSKAEQQVIDKVNTRRVLGNHGNSTVIVARRFLFSLEVEEK